MESGEKEREEAVRDERDEQGSYHCQEECQLSHEREEVPHSTQASVSFILCFHTILFVFITVHLTTFNIDF